MAGVPALRLAGQLSLGRLLSVSVVCERGIMVTPATLAHCEVRVSYYMKGLRKVIAK